MARDKMIEKIAGTCELSPIDDTWEDVAEKILDTIFSALSNPDEKMTFAVRHMMLWLNGRPTESSLAFWCERRDLPIPKGCRPGVDHVPPKAQQAAWVWQAMLAASPLAPEGGET